MGCGSNKTTTVNQSSIPKWIETAGKENYARAKDVTKISSPFTPGYAGLNSTFDAGKASVEANDPSNLYGGARDAITQYTQSGNNPALIGTERIVDEGGRLGSIQDYINPFISGALDPALREITRAGYGQRQNIGDAAHMAGAFGDAANGIQLSEQRRNEQQQIGDTAARGYFDAFAQAMGLRSQDIDRMLGVDTFNANQQDEATQRLLTGGTALAGIDTNKFNAGRAQSQDLFGTADKERAAAQGALDQQFNQGAGERNRAIEDLNIMLSALTGTPTPKTNTQTTTSPDNSWTQLIGAGLGAAF